jgi:hypothetical protein
MQVSSPLIDALSKTTLSTLELLASTKVRPGTSMALSDNMMNQTFNAYAQVNTDPKNRTILADKSLPRAIIESQSSLKITRSFKRIKCQKE